MSKSKYDLSKFKQKISPRDGDKIKADASKRFDKADKALGIDDLDEAKNPPAPPVPKVVRKTFSMPEDELSLLSSIRDKALNEKIVLSDSEAVRCGLLLLNGLSKAELVEALDGITKVTQGRPKKN